MACAGAAGMVSAKIGATAAAASERNHCRRNVISDSLGSVGLYPTGAWAHSKAARAIRARAARVVVSYGMVSTCPG